MGDLLKKMKDAISFIRKSVKETPSFGVVTGSGSGNFKNGIEIEQEIPYEIIPHFPVSKVKGNKGRHMGLPVFAMSVITDLGSLEILHAATYEEVLKAAKEAEPKMTAIVKQLIQGLSYA